MGCYDLINGVNKGIESIESMLLDLGSSHKLVFIFSVFSVAIICTTEFFYSFPFSCTPK